MTLIFTRVFFLALVFLVTSTKSYAQNQNSTGDPIFDTLIQRAVNLRYVNSDSTLAYLQEAQEIPNLSLVQEAVLANQFGAIYYVRGNYPNSLKYYSNALEIAQEAGNLAQEVYAMNGRGLIYLSQHDYIKAAEFFNRCIQINTERKDSSALGTNHFNLGISLSELKQYDSALVVLEKGYQILKSYPELMMRAMLLNRTAQVYLDLGQLDQSKKLFQNVLDSFPKLSNWEKSFTNTGLGWIALKEGQPQKALELGQEAYETARQLGAYWDKERATRLLSEAHEKLGQYAEALVFARLNKVYADSLYDENKNSEISYLQLQLTDAERKTFEQSALAKEQEANLSKKTTYFLSFALLALLIALFVYRKGLKEKEQLNALLLEKQKKILEQNEKLQVINKEKNRIFTVLTHDLKSPINSIKQLLELQNSETLTTEEQDYINMLLLKQVHHTDQMMDELLHWAMVQIDGIVTELEPISPAKVIKEVMAQNEFPAMKKGIKLELLTQNNDLQILADKTQLKIILQNCLHNAIKFSNQGGKIIFEVIDHGSNACLCIRDNGVGMSKEKVEEILQKDQRVSSTPGTTQERGTGLGMLLVKQFLERNNATLAIDSELGKGTSLILNFQKAIK